MKSGFHPGENGPVVLVTRCTSCNGVRVLTSTEPCGCGRLGSQTKAVLRDEQPARPVGER